MFTGALLPANPFGVAAFGDALEPVTRDHLRGDAVIGAGRERLSAIAADRNRPRKHVELARIVLASADPHSPQQVPLSIGVSRPTVWRWQQRCAENGIDLLLRDKTRKPGKAPLAAETTARVVALTCSDPPHQAIH
jgi:hypothetical protein